MTIRRFLATVAVAVVLTACSGEKHFDPPDREARVADAEQRFEQVRFDTIAWASPEERATEGNAVYAAECRTCHGTVGRGSTEYAENRGLEVPSLVEPDWPYAASIDSVRHRVFVGHAAGMPTWGVAGITPREIDAVSYYLLERLRPEVLGGS
jgi:mono/diheme cytochrome c family protein